MQNKSSEEHTDHFDLLPFVAILMCMLGCLLFITLGIVSVSLTQVGTAVDPTGKKQQPVLVEWDQQRTFVQEKDVRDEVNWTTAQWNGLLSGADQGANNTNLPTRIAALLDEVSSHPASLFLFFVVRPKGFGSFTSIRAVCRKRNISVGFAPYESDEKVTLAHQARELTK